MAVKWTEEQKKVITLRDRNILVSAAAGSGKTAVLVQRILSKIMDPLKPVDIDRLLIMTFTRAAAGEMRERIERGLDQALAEDPDNEHLQRQMTLIHTAQITTIDGFCAYVIRNYFHLIGLDPGYRTADEGELKLLQEDVLKELFEDHYAERKADFTAFVECYAPVGGIAIFLSVYTLSFFSSGFKVSCKLPYHIRLFRKIGNVRSPGRDHGIFRIDPEGILFPVGSVEQSHRQI